ncbi:MAG: sodium:calcium antiporter, partial [Chloroflexota bacterium]
MLDLVLAIAMFAGGVALLVYSVEKFVENLAKSAVVLGVSTFILAVVFAGMDFENWAFGIGSVLGGLPGVGVGSAMGSALFLVCGAAGLAGILSPFEPRVPREYLILMVASPLILLLFIFDQVLTRLDGVLLLLAFAAIIAYMYRREKQREYLRDHEVEEVEEGIGPRRWVYPVLMVAFTVGIVAGTELAVRGARGIVEGFGLNQTVFGMTFAGLAMSLEEILLVVEPVRKGRPTIAVGNIVGSLIFFSTGNIGLLAATRSFALDQSVLYFYWPFLFGTVLLMGIILMRGKIRRAQAVPLFLIYIGYWVLSYTVL